MCRDSAAESVPMEIIIGIIKAQYDTRNSQHSGIRQIGTQ
jgi:hypothetical protein